MDTELTAVEAPDDPEDLRASDGRVPGRRGRATRQRLLECTLGMLDTRSFRDLKVVDIAREAGTSPATFYQYFPDVESAMVVLADEMAEVGGDRLSSTVRNGKWRGKTGYDTAVRLVEAFIESWEQNAALLRVIDLATAEGDQRFSNSRTRFLNPATVALSEVIAREKSDGRHPDVLDPMATAASLVAMLAHVSAHRYGLEFWGIRTSDTMRSLARIVFTSVTGQKPPAV